MCWFRVSILPLVQGECAVLGRNLIPYSFIQLLNSVLMEAVPRSCTIDWGIPNECNHFSTTEMVAWAPVFETGWTIKNLENASLTSRQWRFWLLGGWRGRLWSMWIVRNTTVSFCHSSSGASFLCWGFGVLFWQVRQSEVSALIQSNIPGL